jgi:hypothetical protein
VRSFKVFLLIGALFLVVLVALYVVAMFASSRRRIVLFETLKIKSFKKASAEAIRLAFCWRKASVPNHLLHMLYLQDDYALIRTWNNHSGKQYNHKTYDFVFAN